MSGRLMKPRGSPKRRSGPTGRLSSSSVNSASSPTAASERFSPDVCGSPLTVRPILQLRGTRRNEGEIAKVEMEMVVGRSDVVSVRPHPRKRQLPADDGGVALDGILCVERFRTDAINVRG